MSIITSCPHCKTTFSVASEILSKYKGFVRCASCSGVFNAIENAIENKNNDETKPKQKDIKTVENIEHIENTKIDESNNDVIPKNVKNNLKDSLEENDESILESYIATSSQPEKKEKTNNTTNANANINISEKSIIKEDAKQENKKNNAMVAGNTMIESSSFIDRLRYVFTSKTPKTVKATNVDISHNKNKKLANVTELNKRLNDWGHAQKKRPLFMLGSIFLATALFLQILYWQKNNIANSIPSAAPILKLYAKLFGGHLAPLKVSNNPVVSFSDMQKDLSANANRYILNVGLQNRYSGEAAMPNLEVSLFDLNEQIITRRVFHPQLFLKPADWVRLEKYGLRENEELPVKLRFETNQVVSSFKVVVFYP